jgi:hypothetical protein
VGVALARLGHGQLEGTLTGLGPGDPFGLVLPQLFRSRFLTMQVPATPSRQPQKTRAPPPRAGIGKALVTAAMWMHGIRVEFAWSTQLASGDLAPRLGDASRSGDRWVRI